MQNNSKLESPDGEAREPGGGVSSCLWDSQWVPEQVAKKNLIQNAIAENDKNLEPTNSFEFTPSGDVLLQAGHFNHNPWDHNTGAEGPNGREIDWTPAVVNKAAEFIGGGGCISDQIRCQHKDATWTDR
jgi:hypothetical protein